MSQAKAAFTHIYNNNLWMSSESVSGTGSTLAETVKLRERLPQLLNELKVKVFLDAPCGDFNWMKHVSFPENIEQYIGIDIVEDLILKNNNKYKSDKISFFNKDILIDEVPKADLIMSRDCLVHLPFAQIFTALKNFKSSGAKYLLATTFPGLSENVNTNNIGDWRALNLQLPPFNFPNPITLIHEELQTSYPIFQTKSLGLWKLNDL